MSDLQANSEPMRTYIANTDHGWYQFLTSMEDLDEVNFWRPHGATPFKALSYGEPFIFKLKSQFDHAIVGFGFFVAYVKLTVTEAWQVFGNANGAQTLEEMWTRIRMYVERSGGRAMPSHQIGCTLLASPVFFPPSAWIRGPANWRPQIVAGKGYDTESGEGRRIWQECLLRARSMKLSELSAETLAAAEDAPRYGTGILVRPRLGQGTFRFAVQGAYGKCAVTGEKSLPALEASHIIPYAEGGRHEIPNGLLLRADIHRLFDRGYVTVTPDLRFRVSSRLMDEYHNGRQYYDLENRRIWTPGDPRNDPDHEALAYHSSSLFMH